MCIPVHVYSDVMHKCVNVSVHVSGEGKVKSIFPLSPNFAVRNPVDDVAGYFPAISKAHFLLYAHCTFKSTVT